MVVTETVLIYQDLLDRIGPNECFFELANLDIFGYKISRHRSKLLNDKPNNDDKGKKKEEIIEIEQNKNMENSCGGIVWESAFALANYLEKRFDDYDDFGVHQDGNKKVLSCADLGSGTGFLGIYCAKKFKHRTTVTDTIDCVELMERNVKRNSLFNENEDCLCDVFELDWEREEHVERLREKKGTFDLIVATDVIFAERLVDPLIKCIRMLLNEKSGVCFVCAQPRDENAFGSFQERCMETFSMFRRVPNEELSFDDLDSECKLFEMRV